MSEKAHDGGKPAKPNVSNNKRGDLGRGMEQVLAHAQDETRHQLEEAMRRKENTGAKLMDILRQDVDREMFGRIWSFLNNPVESKKEKGETRKVKDVLTEAGWFSSEEWEEVKAGGEEYDPAVGRILMDAGVITEERLNEAVGQSQRSGQSVWRILVNRALVSPKQIADARKLGHEGAGEATDQSPMVQMLLNTGLVTQEQCNTALLARKSSGADPCQALVDQGVVDKGRLGEALGKELGVPYVDMAKVEIEPEAGDLIPQQLAEQNRMMPIGFSEGSVLLAMANPRDAAARGTFTMVAGRAPEVVFAFEKDLAEAIRRYYPAAGAQPAKEGSPLTRLKERLRESAAVQGDMVSLAENVGVVNLVASIIEGAINSRASDVHLEPQSYGLRVRYRIDGMLYDIMNLPDQLQSEVISRVKVLAGMDVTQRRVSQDGHFTINVGEKVYDLRVASLPTVMGEKLALRLLNPEDVFMGFRELGLEGTQLAAMEDAIKQPYGMVLVTGPVAAGKTTTLYAALSEIDIFTQNVVTIEDPVEYQLPGINQVQVDLRVHRTFADMLRSVVRQDTNVMMVGEIRDTDTAEIAVRASLTGHLVFSTLHANDAVGAVDTLKHLGIKPFLIASSVVAVIAQRLVRRICPVCRGAYDPPSALLKAAGLTSEQIDGITFYRPVGCDRCHQTGYRGRSGIFEVFRLDEEMKGLILDGAPHDAVKKQARKAGMTTLMESGLAKVKAGTTTVEELLRVTTA
jgi:type II secretory ATPase GspE/PulE/Tfp pilus assembly ATPase PilB-like protein